MPQTQQNFACVMMPTDWPDIGSECIDHHRGHIISVHHLSQQMRNSVNQPIIFNLSKIVIGQRKAYENKQFNADIVVLLCVTKHLHCLTSYALIDQTSHVLLEELLFGGAVEIAWGQ